jgi:seryl-tRNA synthetase
MSQAPTNGQSLLDPFGVWKAARDANLDAWSKLMIDIVNSDEYAKATGLALEQILATSQPMRDALERSMTQTLSMLNMPSRAEVISIAERLVNVEMRLDDMDAKLNTVQKSLQEAMKKTVNDAMTAQNNLLTDMAGQIAALTAALNPKQAVAPKPAPSTEKTEPKPQPKARVANDLTARKEQEAK